MIQVKDYLLFEKSWSYTIKKGLNLFVGANGLGKTTTANLIIYGIVGMTETLNEEYFSQRKGGINEKSAIRLKFFIKDKSFELERLIRGAVINYLKIDDEMVDASNYDELIADEIGLNSLADLTFLFERFLIREEEGNYLLWNHNDQYRLLQLLINTKSFKRKYDKLASDQLEVDKEYKQLSEQYRKPMKKRLDNLRKERLLELEKREELTDLDSLQHELKELVESINTLVKEKAKSKNKINYLTDTIAKSQSEIYECESNLEQINFQNSKFEKKLYKHIYSDNKLQYSVHKLKYYDSCIFCNQKIETLKSDKIVQKIEVNCKCPVCDSKLKQDGTEEVKNPDNIIRAINQNKVEANSIKKRVKALNKEIFNSQEEYDIAKTAFNEFSKKLSKAKIKKLEIENNILFLKNSNENNSKFDILIEEAEVALAEVEEKFPPIQKKKEKIVESLKKMDDSQSKMTEAILEDLNKIFKKYSTKYFFKDSMLVTNNKKGDASKLQIKYLVPFFDNKQRTDQKNCSTSQRIILEYLFRVALFELYYERSGHTPFMILETTEGAFDFKNTKHLANTINAFNANKKINCVIIANFSKKDFLSILVKGIKNSKNRFKNFLDFSDKQEYDKNDLRTFEMIIREFKLK